MQLSRMHVCLGTVILLAGLGVPAAAQRASQSVPAEGEQELPAPFKRWLEQEVRYIIGHGECRDFVRLSSDEERTRFVESFWSRRDPTPGTRPNEFKEEHYRRIAYVNDRYPSGRPGWTTDRGRTYIVLGPPDEIESHPAGGEYRRPSGELGLTSAQPFEVWMYWAVDGRGGGTEIQFVDTAADGVYPLHSDPPWEEAPQPGIACP